MHGTFSKLLKYGRTGTAKMRSSAFLQEAVVPNEEAEEAAAEEAAEATCMEVP